MIEQYFELKKAENKAIGVREKYLKSKSLVSFCTANNIRTISDRNRKTILKDNKVIGEIINGNCITI
jgi:hypothetical protein